jgi:DNA end-binding protein Ku
MPRSNWKGHISFGLVSIPVALYPSENPSADIHLHQIDSKNNARIKYKRINAETGKEVEWGDIIKGYEYDKDVMVPVPDEVFNKVAGDDARTVRIENFIHKDELDFIAIDKTYYVEPDKKGDKPYVILREALKHTNTVGIARVIISTREYVAAVMIYEDALILCLLKYAKEIRDLTDLDIPRKDLAFYKVSKKEIEIANQLIKSMLTKWKPEQYVDEYQEALHTWVEETVNNIPHKKRKTKEKAATGSNVINFEDLLKQSLKKKAATAGKSAKKKKALSRKPATKSKSARHASYR